MIKTVKNIFIALAAVALLSFYGCSSNPKEVNTEESENTEQTVTNEEQKEEVGEYALAGTYKMFEQPEEWFSISGVVKIGNDKKWTAEVQGLEASFSYAGYVDEKGELIIESAFVDDSEGHNEYEGVGSSFGKCDGKKIEAEYHTYNREN